MGKWKCDQFDLRDAIREGYKASKTDRNKWEIFLRRKGGKKLILVYGEETNEVFVITGTEG